jgi:hypothetical protein
MLVIVIIYLKKKKNTAEGELGDYNVPWSSVHSRGHRYF